MGACLGCQCSDSNDKPLADINKKRGCTDLPWLLLYIAWWGAVWIVIGTREKRGRMSELVYCLNFSSPYSVFSTYCGEQGFGNKRDAHLSFTGKFW